MNEPVSVVVADDHPGLRRGIVDTLAEHPDVDVVGETDDGTKALALIRGKVPDVALCDQRMGGLEGMELVGEVKRLGLPTRVLLLSAFTDSSLVHDAITAGAAGYLSKNASLEELCEGVLSAARGETVVSGDLRAGLIGKLGERVDQQSDLSARELEIVALVADGLSTQEMAQRLHLAASTVKSYLQRAYEKLGVRSQAQAVREAMRRGLIR